MITFEFSPLRILWLLMPWILGVACGIYWLRAKTHRDELMIEVLAATEKILTESDGVLASRNGSPDSVPAGEA